MGSRSSCEQTSTCGHGVIGKSIITSPIMKIVVFRYPTMLKIRASPSTPHAAWASMAARGSAFAMKVHLKFTNRGDVKYLAEFIAAAGSYVEECAMGLAYTRS